MKYIDPEDLAKLPGKRLQDGDTFTFQCHRELGCFNRCCHNLRLFLYPYDVIRLKNRLGMRSDRFLDTHVDVVLRPSNFFPEVLLRMSENEQRPCPFLSKAGCTVYPDRPDACRTFPVEQGVLFDAQTGRSRWIHLFRPPAFCLGRFETQEWTCQSWEKDQQAALYHRMTLRWSELKRLFQTDPWGSQGPASPKAKMAFMATYNLDRFREFVFDSSFLRRYEVVPAVQKAIRTDDRQLMLFGFAWVELTVWGIATRQIRPR